MPKGPPSGAGAQASRVAAKARKATSRSQVAIRKRVDKNRAKRAKLLEENKGMEATILGLRRKIRVLCQKKEKKGEKLEKMVKIQKMKSRIEELNAEIKNNLEMRKALQEDTNSLSGKAPRVEANPGPEAPAEEAPAEEDTSSEEAIPSEEEGMVSDGGEEEEGGGGDEEGMVVEEELGPQVGGELTVKDVCDFVVGRGFFLETNVGIKYMRGLDPMMPMREVLEKTFSFEKGGSPLNKWRVDSLCLVKDGRTISLPNMEERDLMEAVITSVESWEFWHKVGPRERITRSCARRLGIEPEAEIDNTKPREEHTIHGRLTDLRNRVARERGDPVAYSWDELHGL